MQSVPPTRSGVVSRGISTSGSASTAAEGINEHDNIKVTAICKSTSLMHVHLKEALGETNCCGHINYMRVPRQSGGPWRCMKCPRHVSHGAGGCPAETTQQPGGGEWRHRSRHSRS